MYNTHMAISRKRSRFIDEYLIDLNASAAYIRAGYSENGARQSAYKLLQDPEIKEELNKRLKAGRMTSEEIIQRLELMAMGELPTKTVLGAQARKEYNTESATVNLGRTQALFTDKYDLGISHLNITDDEDA